MTLTMEPLTDAFARQDKTIRFRWTPAPFSGPYDPGEYVIDRGAIYRGQRMSVTAAEDATGPYAAIVVWFEIQPITSDIVTFPIFDVSE